MTRRALSALAAVAFLAAACSSEEPASGREPTSTPAPDATAGIDAALAPFYGQTLEWETCRDEFECATARVPLDYDTPDGEVIELALLRAPATGDDRIGSLLVNPGGPGGSGVDYATSTVVNDAVRERYDIVGFDPRGVGESTPIDCLSDAELDEFVSADGSPDDAGEVMLLQAQSARLADGCATDAAAMLPNIGTSDVARDMDVLRAALGDDRLNYVGKSYGTYIGAIYADQFPERVGRVVLDGAIDPGLTGTELALGQAEGFEAALNSYLDYCLDGEECPLGRIETEARSTLANLLDVIDATPLPTGDESRPLTQGLAIRGIALPLYLTPDEGYPVLSLALDDALSGDGAALQTLADLYLFRNPDGTYDGNMNEAIYAVNCLDRPHSTSIADIEAATAAFEAASPIFGPFLAWDELTCVEWLVPPATEAARVSASGAAPIVVVGTTGDPATPYEWAESLASQLESGVLVSYEGSVHTAYREGSECVDDAVDTFLLDGTAPDDDLRCE
ncbi:MAG TPA: alpha/beta hydrolase [Jiangellaceae bacterium]|nr:alpha/beta hydrolase [Jiangellaceae bacterium]